MGHRSLYHYTLNERDEVKYKAVRRMSGYCCEPDSGTPRQFIKSKKRGPKRKDQEAANKEILDTAKDVMKRHHKLLKRLKD